MVGGFSESPMLQQEIRKNFANQSRILIPNDVSLTILKGTFFVFDKWMDRWVEVEMNRYMNGWKNK